MNKYICEINLYYFEDEPFSKKDAFRWMINNSFRGALSYPIRFMAGVWKWHYSRVNRFLAKLKEEDLIKTSNKSGVLHITICQYNFLAIEQSAHMQGLQEYAPKHVQDRISEDPSAQRLQNPNETNQQHNQINLQDAKQNRSCSSVNEAESCATLQSYCETIAQQSLADDALQEEEKKKRTKKRKEEELKEKNIPFGDIKKKKPQKNLLQIILI